MHSSEPLYDHIGAGYNSTRQADPYLTAKLYRLLSARTDGAYIDIGCGTGNYTIALAEKGLNFFGIEPSEKMLAAAINRDSKVKWLKGEAENLPVEDDCFDGGIATLTIHHWTDLHKAFVEIYRVLKRNALLVIFTATSEQMHGYWLNHYFPKMLEESVLQMPSFETVSNATAAAGFKIVGTEKYFIQDDLRDHFLYVGKNRPELYLDEKIRAGISSFSVLANAVEVQNGLQQLRLDLDNGRCDEIKAGYENDLGDYLFIILQKC
ncbi:MAG TPA: class I SAM-dependent methyltransferase [Mucilaginibacter sp.]|jgi:ubiquinone/menaquinone biosynthesis C-methylase UbiE|nr:class I SAM-dependent methyltransferase [Mucilaginibacter sp.]